MITKRFCFLTVLLTAFVLAVSCASGGTAAANMPLDQAIKEEERVGFFLAGAKPVFEPEPQGDIFPEGLLYEVVDKRFVTITKYIGSDTKVRIPALIETLPVTIIGDYAFSECKLTSVIIPPSVTTIGDLAFLCCQLTSIIIPSSVTTIGNQAFDYNRNLTNINVDTMNSVYMSVGGVLFSKNGQTLICYPAGKSGAYTVPSSVTTIGEGAFLACDSLTSVDIPDSVTTIEWSVFWGCKNLTDIKVFYSNKAYTSVGGVLFSKNGQTLICYPAGKSGAYTVPSSVTTIGNGAFWSCISLTSVDIPFSVTTIEGSAFSDCISLTSISIPRSVTTIESGAFYKCGSLTSVDIPSSVTTIGDLAFFNCGSLTNVDIPSSVITIGNLAFAACNKLTRVTLSRRTRVEVDAFNKSVRIQYRD